MRDQNHVCKNIPQIILMVQGGWETLITQNPHALSFFHITPYGYAQVHWHVITCCQLKAFPCSALFKDFVLSHHIKVDTRVRYEYQAFNTQF